MAGADESTPVVRRGPGRPRKVVEEPKTQEAPKIQEEPKQPEVKRNLHDPRIGEKVADDRWRNVSFADGSEYRVEGGVIVEKVC